MLDLEFSSAVISNDSLLQEAIALIGEPLTTPSVASMSPGSCVAGCRLFVPAPTYSAMQDGYESMYYEYYGRRACDTDDPSAWYDYFYGASFGWADDEPVVVLPPDAENAAPVTLTSLWNDHSAFAAAGVKQSRSTAPLTETRHNPSRTRHVEHPAASTAQEQQPRVVQPPVEWQHEQKRLAALASVTSDEGIGFVLPWEEKPMPESPCLPGLENCSALPLLLPADGRPPNALRFVAGLDISFVKDSSAAVASIAVLDYPSLKLRYSEMVHCSLSVPYVPGYLAFREVQPLMQVVRTFREKHPSIELQLLLVDGNGILHSRRCGLATHLGVLLDIPTIGVAKNLLNVDGLSRADVLERVKAKAAATVDGQLASWSDRAEPLFSSSHQLLGYGVLTGHSTTKPIFISPGHRVSCESALRLVLSMTPFRVVEPIRQADLLSREYIRIHFAANERAPETQPNQDERLA